MCNIVFNFSVCYGKIIIHTLQYDYLSNYIDVSHTCHMYHVNVNVV